MARRLLNGEAEGDPMKHFVTHLAWPLSHWAERSQRQACRNAMVASTVLSASRRERDEARDFIERLLSHRDPRSTDAKRTLPAARLG